MVEGEEAVNAGEMGILARAVRGAVSFRQFARLVQDIS